MDELQKENYTRLYTCTNPKYAYDVVPITHILGSVPLMPDCSTPTIPSKYSKQKAQAFPAGQADSSVGSGDGSSIFYVNHFGLTWSRSKLSLHRYLVFHVYCMCAACVLHVCCKVCCMCVACVLHMCDAGCVCCMCAVCLAFVCYMC